MKILVAGAGIGGLTSALCLARAGYEVHIFEQADKLTENGAGLQCGANAMRVLQYLGLEQSLKSLAVIPQSIQFRQYQTGASLYQVELGQTYAERYGAPYYHLHRADLVTVLADAAAKHSNITLHFGQQVLAYRDTETAVEVMLSNHPPVRAGLLVACDGVKSKVRTQLLSELGQSQLTKPRFTGNVAWRATVPVTELPENLMPTVVTNFVGPGKHMVLYYVRAQKLMNMVGVVDNALWRDDSWLAKASWQELKSDFSGWHPTVQAVINAVDKEACFRWALYDHKPLLQWSSKRVTLLGDAAHATLPFMASGAAMAIEDARILQRCLVAEHHTERALVRYQNNRISRTTKIQNTSRKFGTLYHIQSPLLQRAAFASLRLMGGKKEDFLPEYDANRILLT